MSNLLVLLSIFFGFSASAKTFEQKYYDIAHFTTTVTEVAPVENSVDSIQPELYSTSIILPPATPDGGLTLMEVANLAWIIIDRNRPTANIHTKFANALPVVAQDDWQLVTGWRKNLRAFKSKTIGTNSFGMDVIVFEYMVMMYYGGSYEGKGLFLKNVTAEPVDLKLSWGFNVDVTVKIPSVANIGTTDDPIASMLLTVELDIRSMFSHRTMSDTYQVEGNGKIMNVGTANLIFPEDRSLLEERRVVAENYSAR